MALTHREKWNGEVYPIGIRSKEIPLGGPNVALADEFDGWCSDRKVSALQIMRANVG